MISDKKELPLISIVLPTYNRAYILPEAVHSVLAQTYSTWELIIVDDGSSDKTFAIAKSLEKKYPYIKIISYSPNKGKAYAVEKGFDSAKGDVIMIWDADRTVPEGELHLFYEKYRYKKAPVR